MSTWTLTPPQSSPWPAPSAPLPQPRLTPKPMPAPRPTPAQAAAIATDAVNTAVAAVQAKAMVALRRQQAMREIVTGIVLIVIGVAVTVGSIAAQLPIFLVAWGPVLGGIRLVFRGLGHLATAGRAA